MDETLNPPSEAPEPELPTTEVPPSPPTGTAIPEPPFPPAPGVPSPPSAEEPPFAEAPVGYPVPGVSGEPPGRGGGRRIAIIIVVLVVVIGAIAGAVVATSGGGKKAAPTNGSSSPSPQASPVLFAPANLATDVEALSVTLSWSPPAGGAEVQRYAIYRNDSYLGSVTAPETTYTDESVVPGKKYTYAIEAVGADLTSERVSTPELTTPIPSLASARVQGNFNVVPKLVSKSGYSSYGANFTLGWHFKPKCGDGPCNVLWNDLVEKSFKATLKRDGKSYSGSDTGDFNSTCGSAHHDSKLTITFKVVKAKAINGAWRARKLEGTIVQYDAPQLGCVTGRATLSFTATLLA